MVCTDVDENIYFFKAYVKTMKHSPSYIPIPLFDVIPWSFSISQQELDEDFNIDSMTDSFTRQVVLQIIKDN